MENQDVSFVIPQVDSDSWPQDGEYDSERKAALFARFRNFLSQFAAILAIDIIKFSIGFMTGVNTILVAEFYRADAEIKFSLEQLTWFSCYFFMGPIGSILSRLIAHLLGSRVAVLVGTAVLISCGVTFYLGTSAELLLVAQAFLGLFFSVTFVPCLSYMSEVSEPRFRSIFIVSGMLSALFGAFFGVLMGSLMYWRNVILVHIFITSIGFVAIYLIPNPPQWLASKGRLTEAVKSMAWLRGCAMHEQVKQDYSFLRDDRDNALNISQDTAGATENHSLLEKKKKSKKEKVSFCDRSFFLPLLSVCYLFLIRSFTGSLVILTYSMIIFEAMNSPIETHVATVALNGARLASGISCIFIIRFTGIRKLLFTSLSVSGLAMLLASLFLFLHSRNGASEMLAWVAPVMVIIASFAASTGCDRIGYMLSVELFPTKYRSVGAGLGHFVNGIINGVFTKFFLYWIHVWSLHVVFFTFGAASFFGLTTLYFIIPEIQGKSIKEIEKFYSRKKYRNLEMQ